MMDFEDEFSESELVKKPYTPIQYAKLENIALVKRDLDTFPDFLKSNALDKYQLITFIEKTITGGWTQKNLDPILDALFTTTTDKRPNWRTLVRWRKSYIDSNGDLASLVAKRHKMGNRTSRVKGDEVFFEQALTRFLDAKRPKVSTAYQYYKDAITIENESIIDGQIPIISYKSFNQRIKSLPPYPVAVARHGKFKADQWFAYCSSHIPPTRILERVEIDHTPLDLILIDDELSIPIGRPYLTLIVDVFSGCVLGFHLSYRSPSYVSAAKAIVHAIKPKSLEGLDIELQNEWPCFGKFENLVVDNGAEFWSKSLEHACKEAGINIQYNPVRKPWLKPFVERFFGMINECFLTEIPGKTFSNILAKEDFKPEKDAIMRFSTFVEEFHRWIVDVYHQDSNSRETRIPIKQWQRGFDIYPPLKMSAEDEQRFTVLMGISDERTLTRNGFKYEELMYDSTALADYRKHYPQTKETIKKIIKVDPDDLSSIHVYLEELGGYLKVPCTDNSDYTQGLSLHEHKVIKKINREIIREGKDNLGLAKARMAIHARVKQEQEAFQISNTKAKISGVKKQAQLADVSNTGQGTIRLESEELLPSLPKKSESNISNLLEHWDDDVEAFE
ncbi:Mu transposase C-terminal domain-containing protein [Pseudoalteromonas sp.]|uniref:Mu transposase C-terminal domain-containing protein n=1 Tax=Pseudoalteromonas sp. TaxID=53249 RepID=UPI00257971EA|nr:Mu transposase C-terminal domain-containing protein [Pseudoalteromonas sp.]